MPSFAQHARFAPAVRLASRTRKRLTGGGLTVWLLKAALRHASRHKRGRTRHDPQAWHSMWDKAELDNWPGEPITGVVDSGDVKLVIDRSEITKGGHLWVDGWALTPSPAASQLEAHHCTIEWQSTFATWRSDVVESLQLSLLGRDARIGFQILARIADYVPGRSRLALTIAGNGSAPRIVVPVVPQIERSSSVWHSVYDAMRHRGPRDVAYLQTSVGLLKELRKADWRERTQPICKAIDDQMAPGAGLKVLLLSRIHPDVAYLNLNLLAAVRRQPTQFIVCSMGQKAIQRANEYREHFATLGVHTVRFVNAEIATPSSEVIEQFVLSCQRRRCAGLIVYDDVAVASAMGSFAAALGQETIHATAWPRRFPDIGPAMIDYTEPLQASDGPGPYWRSAKAMGHDAVGALLFDPGGFEVPSIPPFEGRGYALDYLVKSVLCDAAMSDETLLDLVDPAGQREAQDLDMLMLLAS